MSESARYRSKHKRDNRKMIKNSKKKQKDRDLASTSSCCGGSGTDGKNGACSIF